MTAALSISPLPKSRVEMTFCVPREEMGPFLDRAVIDITTEKPLRGFRPGKASYNEVKQVYGEKAIWERALELLIPARYAKAVTEHHLETVDPPDIRVEKLVPQQAIIFVATASLMPRVTHLMDYAQPLVTHKTRCVTDQDVQSALENLRKLQRTEIAVSRSATTQDAVVIDLEITKGGVVIEGGHAHAYTVYLFEPHYIPGFTDHLIGKQKGDVITFELAFPQGHYNKQLSGQMQTFTVTIQDVLEIALPDPHDVFAQSVGCASIHALQERLRQNLQEEADKKSSDAAEIELLEILVKGSQFTEIPDVIITEEVRRMYHELERSVEAQGMHMEDYLASLKKTPEQMKLDFVPRAVERVQTIVLLKEIGKREQIEVTNEEISTEQDRLFQAVPHEDMGARARIASGEYRDFLAVRMKNQKILDALKRTGIRM